jgi:hypothetical protein
MHVELRIFRGGMLTLVEHALLLSALLLCAAQPAAARDMIEPPLASSLSIPHQRRFDLTKYGGTGDGVTLNTDAFEATISAIKAAGGGELYVPAGVWLTTGFALTSHMSLFLEQARKIPLAKAKRGSMCQCSPFPIKIEVRCSFNIAVPAWAGRHAARRLAEQYPLAPAQRELQQLPGRVPAELPRRKVTHRGP